MPFDFACPDWEDRLRRGLPPIADLPLNDAAAEKAVGVYDNLRLPDVAGQPTLGEAGGDWFREIVRAAFGSDDPVTGERAVGEIFCLVPKKNSKTTNSAALGLTALLLNETPNVEMLIVGPTKDVAETCFGQVMGMIDADPEDPETGSKYLQHRFHVREHALEIYDRWTKSTLKVKAFSKNVITGTIPALTIIDELHVMGSMAHAAKVLAQIRGGMITRPDALLLIITTQSDEPPAGVFRSELIYARRVRDGEIKDGNLLPVLYELPESIQTNKDRPWRDAKYWPMVLPNLGRSITLNRLKLLYQKALEKGPEDELVWASQHLNLQLGMGTHSEAWIGATLWPVGENQMSLDEFLDQCEVVTAGIDGGGLDDLFGLALVGRHKVTRDWLLWMRAWVQPEVLKLRKDIAPRLKDFEAQGDLVICEDATSDLRDVADILSEVHGRGLFPAEYAIGLDPFGVSAMIDELALKQIDGTLVMAIGQGTRLSPSVWGMERKLKNGTFLPCGQEMMEWCVGNAKTEQRGNAVLITKAVSGKAKIDPLIAALNAFTLMARNPEASGGDESPWDDPEFSLYG